EIAERLANDRPSMSVKAPFVDLEKSEIVRLGSRLNIPFEKTWSCYKGGSEHCGSCSSCSERKRAFLESEIEDPTVYSL
ncbi:MAG: 7-cyano-7-deazaguanine synthase, partial [Ignavibacteria bacterium]|nr:7-cyano-7-deazaguanine synthase [Ignavibacteria bacterium]